MRHPKTRAVRKPHLPGDESVSLFLGFTIKLNTLAENLKTLDMFSKKCYTKFQLTNLYTLRSFL